MLRNYFVIAIRNIRRHKMLSFINIAGLSVGLACFFLFAVFAFNQLNFDSSHTNKDRIFRLIDVFERTPGGELRRDAIGGIPQGPLLKKDLPDIQELARIQRPFDEKLIRIGNEVVRDTIRFADASIFSVFTFPIIHGRGDALADPRKIVVTESRAMQWFGQTDVVGKTVEMKIDSSFEPFVIGAVAKDMPPNSSVVFNVLGSIKYFLSTPIGRESQANVNMQVGCETYFLLAAGSRVASNNKLLTDLRAKYYPEEADYLRKEGLWNGTGPMPIRFGFQPLKDVHLQPEVGGMAPSIDPSYIWILLSIAFGILLIACINFTTLAIARSAGRAKEVGVRKVMGGKMRQIATQFIFESFLFTVIASVFAVLLVKALTPLFNSLSGTFLLFDNQTAVIAGLVIIVALTSLLAGAYPSFVLSKFNPLAIFKAKIRVGGANAFTKWLVTFQFCLSILFISGSAIMVSQLNYMRNRNLGFNKENVIVLTAEGSDATRKFPIFRETLQSVSGILNVSGSEIGLGEGAGFMGSPFQNNGELTGVIRYPVDEDFVVTLGMQLLRGRNFSKNVSIDSVSSIIVNENFLRDFNIPLETAVGTQVREAEFQGPGVDKLRDDAGLSRTIIGVVRNFNYSKLSDALMPQIFVRPGTLNVQKIFIRIQPGNPSHQLAVIEKAWKKVFHGFPFEYHFLDDAFDRFYKTEENWTRIAASAGAISIFLACLGLFGLANLSAVNKTKEIGIRKVLGASTASITRLLTVDFLKLVLIAIVVAVPVSWYLMNRWLEGYFYRIDIQPGFFITTGFFALMIAALTVGLHAIRKAAANPVNSLRAE
jgi:putative ABC transport system permease protein